MPLSLILVCLWALCANVLAMLPSRDNHWRRAYALIVAGVPLVGYVTWETGPWMGLLVLAGGMSLLRWPLIRAARWTVARMAGKEGADSERSVP